jgi:hypothetical protein
MNKLLILFISLFIYFNVYSQEIPELHEIHAKYYYDVENSILHPDWALKYDKALALYESALAFSYERAKAIAKDPVRNRHYLPEKYRVEALELLLGMYSNKAIFLEYKINLLYEGNSYKEKFFNFMLTSRFVANDSFETLDLLMMIDPDYPGLKEKYIKSILDINEHFRSYEK